MFAIKSELFGNIPLILDTNDLQCYKKTVHKVELFFVKHNPSVIERTESFSVECNPPVVQELESFSVKYNAFVSAKLPIVNDINKIELFSEAMIKTNKHLFKLVSAINKYVKMFDFGEDYLIIQI